MTRYASIALVLAPLAAFLPAARHPQDPAPFSAAAPYVAYSPVSPRDSESGGRYNSYEPTAAASVGLAFFWNRPQPVKVIEKQIVTSKHCAFRRME